MTPLIPLMPLSPVGIYKTSDKRTPTNCMLLTQHPTNANVIGYSSDFLNGGAEAYGTMLPNTTADGTLIYSYEIDHSTGLFVLKFGEDSVTQLNNVSDAVLYHNADGAEGNMLFTWDDINKWYSATDVDKSDAMKAHLDTVICLEATAIPRVLIWYDFETMVVEGYEGYVPKQVQIRYTSTDDLTTLDAYAIGGTAYITDNGDGTYDLWSDDACEFIALSDDYNNVSGLNITEIEVINGYTLKYFYYTDENTIHAYTFGNMPNVATIDVSSIDGSNITNMDSMFLGCSSLTSLDVTNFDTSSVTNMAAMFSSCEVLSSIDVSNFTTINVTDMNSMFGSCYALTYLDLTSFDTTNVTSMVGMFYEDASLLCMTNLDTTNVTEKNFMFSNCTSLVQPDATAQTDLADTNGADWSNPGSCP